MHVLLGITNLKTLNICTYIEYKMATKCITITNEAYERLASFKVGSESFSDVINKITRGHSLFDLVGVLSHKQADELRSNVNDVRKRMREQVESRVRRL